MSPRKKSKKKYKLKTHKPTAKRFEKTGGGKIVHMKIARSHLRRRKSKRVKQQFKKKLSLQSRGIKRRVERLAPHLD
jgi:large subunit ribosomal protein L35